MEAKTHIQKKLRVVCLHGFRTSGAILKNHIDNWPQTLLQNLDLHFPNAPFPATGKSDVESIFEWYNSNKDYTKYKGFEESIAYIEDYMLTHGPFDGVLGFSQGAIISSALPMMQEQGVALTKVEKIKFIILISGVKFRGLLKHGQPKLAANAFSSPIHCPSVHFIGEADFLKEEGIELVQSFVNPVVIYHKKGHTVPKLDEKSTETMLRFINTIKSRHGPRL